MCKIKKKYEKLLIEHENLKTRYRLLQKLDLDKQRIIQKLSEENNGKEEKIEKHNYSAKLIRVVDGDTCDALIDLGFDTWVKKRIRFYGVDTWESRTRNLEEKVKGLAAKTKDLLENSDEGKF